jgi:hypothetical protein
MLHKNAMKLLQAHGASISSREFVPENSGSIHTQYTATLNKYELRWEVDGFSKQTVRVEYSPPGHCSNEKPLLAGDGVHVGNGTLMKRFIEKAASRLWDVNGICIEFGPEATHPKLAFSLRAKRLGPFWQWLVRYGTHDAGDELCNVRTPEALVMGQAAEDGDCPPEALLDWLKDNGYLAEEA